jgi:hypothetical protein
LPVKFYADEASFPGTGVVDTIYVAKSEKTSWYWDGAAYQQIGGGSGGGGFTVLATSVSPGSSTGGSVANDVFTYTLPANTVAATGNVLRIEVTYATTGADAKSCTVLVNGASKEASSASTTAADYCHKIEFMRSGTNTSRKRAESWRALSVFSVGQPSDSTDWTANNDIVVRLTSVTAGSIVVHTVKVILEG